MNTQITANKKVDVTSVTDTTVTFKDTFKFYDGGYSHVGFDVGPRIG